MIIDIHNHTMPRSYDSLLTPEDLIRQAKQAGLDAICLTEHDFFWEPAVVEELSTEHGLLILPGVEINIEEGHVLVFGLERWVYGMHQSAFLKQMVDEVGGAMILAHPYRRQLYPDEDLDSAVERACQNHIFDLVDAIEVLNGKATAKENSFSLSLSGKLGLKTTGGSDAHFPREVASCATLFERSISCLQELITELKAGRFRPIDLRKESSS